VVTETAGITASSLDSFLGLALIRDSLHVNWCSMSHRVDTRRWQGMEYPETENLRHDFLCHKKASGKSFCFYAQKTSVSRRTLIDFAGNKIRPLYETGKKLEVWLLENPTSSCVESQDVALDKVLVTP